MGTISQFSAPTTLSPEQQLLIRTEQKVVSTLEQRSILPLLEFEPPIPRPSVPYYAHYDVLNYSNYLSPYCFNSFIFACRSCFIIKTR